MIDSRVREYRKRVYRGRMVQACANLAREQAEYEFHHELCAVAAGYALASRPKPHEWQVDYMARLWSAGYDLLRGQHGCNN